MLQTEQWMREILRINKYVSSKDLKIVEVIIFW